MAANTGSKVPWRQEVGPWWFAHPDLSVDGTDRADKLGARSMKRQHRPRTYWLGRVLRGRRLDRNPLRRRSDRVETAVFGVLLAVFLAAAPFAAHAAGSWAYATSARAAQAEQAKVRHVPATLLAAAPVWTSTVAPDVAARWRAPDGQVRTGEVFVPAGAAAGSTILVWINRAGQLADPPLGTSQLAARAQMAAYAAAGSLAVILIAAGWLARRSLDRRRLAAWDSDWLANGPRWSQRR